MIYLKEGNIDICKIHFLILTLVSQLLIQLHNLLFLLKEDS